MNVKKILTLLVTATSIIACTDDQENTHPRLDGYIYFNVSQNSQWAEDGKTRSAIDAPMLMDCDIEGAQPMYLHTEITPTPVVAVAPEVPETRGNRHTGPVFQNGSIVDFGVYAVTSGGSTFMNGFQISGMTQDGTVTESNTIQTTYWYVKDYDANGSWPDGETATFYGYAPYFAPNAAESNTNGLRVYNNSGVPTIEYIVPEDGANQIDLLTAKSGAVSKGSDVELVFDHVLSAVKFGIKNTTTFTSTPAGLAHDGLQWTDGLKKYNVTITDVAIKQVYKKGTWNVGDQVYASSGDDPANNWTLDTSVNGDFTISSLGKALSGSAPTGGEVVNPDNGGKVFMMLPQTTPTGAKLEITCTMANVDNSSDTKEVKFTLPLENKTWKPGYTYNYTLALTDLDYVFTIEENSAADYSGTTTDKNGDTFAAPNSGKNAFKLEIKSYKMDANDNQGAVSWKAYYSTDNGSTYSDGIPNEWVHLVDNTSTRVNTDIHIGAKSTEEARKFDLVVDEYLVKKNMDLSLYNIDNETRIKRSTANCYIVAEPGIYRIPLIYGNAYNNGAENTGSYISTQSNLIGVILQNFKNYMETDIRSPYIKTDIANSSKTIESAGLVWEDVEGLVSEIQLVESDAYGTSGQDNRYLQFKIAPATMNYGNAIVAIKDASGQIIWSWHIWVSDPEKFTSMNTYSTTRDGVTYSFSGANLGWVDKYDQEITLEQPRSLKIKLVQEESGKELEFTVSEDGVKFTPEHRNAMYQFGRKDPMAGATPNSGTDAGTNITTYGPLQFQVSDIGASKLEIAEAIQNPNIQYIRGNATTATRQKHLFYGSASTGDEHKNLWNIHAPFGSNNSVQKCYGKSVYDPSPIGYRVPASAAFANFGLGSWNLLDYRTSGKNDGYLYASFGGGKIIFPFVGYRDSDNSGAPVDFNKTTYYGLASGAAGDYNEYQMVRMAYHESLGTKGFDDSHKGMRNRSTQIRAILDPDGIPERDVDVTVHEDDTVEPEESLSRKTSF